jgi:hypothetical protein
VYNTTTLYLHRSMFENHRRRKEKTNVPMMSTRSERRMVMHAVDRQHVASAHQSSPHATEDPVSAGQVRQYAPEHHLW